MAAVHSASPTDENGIVRCYKHGLEAVLRTSRTPNNFERQFYCCPKLVNDDGCGFICWADKPSSEPNPASPSNVSSQQGQQTQQSGSYVPATPRKRPFNSTFPLTPPESGSSQKRKRIMEEALAEQSTPTHSNPQARTACPSFHRDKGADVEEALWTLPTSPSSSQKLEVPHGNQSYGIEENDPFISQSSPSSQVSVASSTTMWGSSGKGAELSPDSISTLLRSLDGIPEYLRKLERKKIAAEKSSEAKAKRIAELEAEVEKLKGRNSALRSTIRDFASGD